MILATAFKDLEGADVLALVGSLATADMESSGILASVTLAQFILESGWGKSELAQNANNCFGMKASLSGNTWEGSVWDGTSVYTKETKEQNTDGSEYTVTADFRSYPCVEDSIADHSAYLAGAMNGKVKRYAGLVGETDYKTAIQLIKDGGYATDTEYVSKLCNLVETYSLTQYDAAEGTSDASNSTEYPEKLTSGYYRVRKEWSDSKSQLGAYRILSNAKAKADANTGYYVFSNDGVKIYPEDEETGEETTEEPDEDTTEDSGYPNDGNTTPVLYAKSKTLMNVRAGNSLDAAILTTIKKGTFVDVLEVCDNGWYRIACDASETGYAYVSNVSGIYFYTGKTVYTVVSGDTLWRIAETHLGSGTKYTKIKECNGLTSNVIRVGMLLLIP